MYVSLPFEIMCKNLFWAESVFVAFALRPLGLSNLQYAGCALQYTTYGLHTIICAVKYTI